ncbi:glycosyltransferase family 2 protein [Alteraurantiacibacter aquimixticola]|uniref:Glycosyltransferase n=1 Tax=Alteraurantiacibacter aquimixticola TaxID=2489173 RepID=A0A4T3EYW9_9SPHN|nr:glycosyltransferase [Alteraurantiacibacter aquimixticola]TIX49868.1 glycosyltransferase [Alteraurantiacibacter aquimixticola]
MQPGENSSDSLPTLSVAMSVYNGERFLAEAVGSILAQSFGDFEFLILDDGSSDRTAGIIRDFAARDSRIRPIIRENRGLVASLNQLLTEARAPLVARMDADDVCLPDRFARQVAFLEANPDHGVVGCWSYDIDEKGEPWRIDAADHPVTHADFLHNIRHGGPLLVHPAVMYRADIVRSVGGYHAAFRHCEDLDLWLRLASVTKLANLPERLIRYRHYPEQVSKRHATEQQVGAAIAYEAWRARDAGRPDPTAEATALPPITQLDEYFGQEGVARRVRQAVTGGILHSPVALRDEGFDIMLQSVRDGGSRSGMWRTVARLLKLGEPLRALRLTAALAGI